MDAADCGDALGADLAAGSDGGEHSAAAALAGGGAAKALATVRGRGVLVYGVDLPVPHPAGLCRRGGSRCFAGGSSVAMAVCAGDGPSDGRGAQIHSGRLLYHSGVGVGQNRAAGDPHLLYHGAAAGLQQSLSGDCCRGPEAVGDGKGVRAFRLENLPLLLSAGNPAFFPVGSQQCAGTCVEIGHRCRGAGQTADCHRDQNL